MNFTQIAERNKILEVRAGSHLFGTTTPDADLDIFGIFMPSKEMLFGFQTCNEVDSSITAKDASGRNTRDATDRKLYEYRKFCKLALQNNPNILHLLFANEENILFINDFGRRLLDKRHAFIHKGAYHRFVSYAKSQLHKMMIKPENYKALEEGLLVLESLDDHTTMSELKETLPFTYSNGQHVKVGDLSIELGVYAKTARKQIRDRLAKATHRSAYYTKYGYDLKFASNLIHLLKEGIYLLKTGELVFPLPYAQEILDIKLGKYTAEQITTNAENLLKEAEEAFQKSEMPEHADATAIEKFVIDEVERSLRS